VTNLVKRVGLKKSAAPRHAVRHLQLEVAGWPNEFAALAHYFMGTAAERPKSRVAVEGAAVCRILALIHVLGASHCAYRFGKM
jgi:hypothetical protein